MSPLEILIGKALPELFIGTAEATVIILVAVFWFDIPLRGDLLSMVILRGVFLEATPFHLLVDQLWSMAAIGLVTLVIAGWLVRRHMQ